MDEIKIQISDEFIDKIVWLMENVRDSNFAIGDILVGLVDLHPGKRAEVINYIAGRLAITASTLYDYENTSRRWSVDKRLEYPALDWTIYRNSDPVIDMELLNESVKEGWNATTFKEKMFPALLEPERIIKRVISLLDKIVRSDDVPERVEAALLPVIEELQDIYDQLDETSDYSPP